MAKKIIPYEDVDYFNGLKKQAEDNSKAWHETEDTEKRAGLNRANQMLYEQMDSITGGKSKFNTNTGLWETGYNDGNSWRTDAAPAQKQFTSPWTSKINDTLSEIEKSSFSYNPENDNSYKAYADMYKREGDRAAKSTLADISTAQGGISTYAGQAAQQAANYYAQQLTDRIPELEALAYEKYGADLNNKYNALNSYINMENADYNKFIKDRDYMDFLDERKYQRENDAYDRAYNEEQDALDRKYQQEIFDWEKEKYNDTTAYKRGQDEIKNTNNKRENLIAMMIDGYVASEEELAEVGLTTDFRDTLLNKSKLEAMAALYPDLVSSAMIDAAYPTVNGTNVFGVNPTVSSAEDENLKKNSTKISGKTGTKTSGKTGTKASNTYTEVSEEPEDEWQKQYEKVNELWSKGILTTQEAEARLTSLELSKRK